MKGKPAEDLAKEYDFKNAYGYFGYIFDSLINGQRKQVRDLFNKMNKHSQTEFLNDYCLHSGVESYNEGISQSIRNICIDELINQIKWV